MSRKFFLIPIILLAVSLFWVGILPIPVQAQEDAPEVSGDVFLIDGLGTPSNPDVAWNDFCDMFLIVYERKQTSGDYNIWGRYVFDTGLGPAGDPFQITYNSSDQAKPAVAYNNRMGGGDGGNYLVAWEDYRNGRSEIYAQLWDCEKRSASKPVLVTPNDTYQQSNPDVACGYFSDVNNSGCWVVWEDFRNGHWDIYGQWLNISGAPPVGVGNVRITTNTLSQRYPAITRNSQGTGCSDVGSFMVAWMDSRNTFTTGSDIYIQQLDNVGRCGSGNLPVTTNAGDQTYPDLAYGTNNGAYQVVWQDYRNTKPGSSYADIYARMINSNGGKIGFGDFAISNPVSNQLRPAVCYSANISNQFNTVWYDNRKGNLNIYGQRSGAGGVGGLVGVNYPISTNTNNETSPAIAYSSLSGHYFVVWMGSAGIEGKAVWWP